MSHTTLRRIGLLALPLAFLSMGCGKETSASASAPPPEGAPLVEIQGAPLMATTEPAPEPRPGPTGMSFAFAQ